MLFAHDTDTALLFAASLVNTRPGPGRADGLSTVESLDAFLDDQRMTGRRDHDEAELEQVRNLRYELRTVWSASRDDAVVAVNAMLAHGDALPRLVRHDQWDYHVHATASDAPLVTRLGVEAAMALVDVIRTDEMTRLRVCAADDCDHVLVDLSRNRSRRYCDWGCGPRLHTAAYRARRSKLPANVLLDNKPTRRPMH